MKNKVMAATWERAPELTQRKLKHQTPTPGNYRPGWETSAVNWIATEQKRRFRSIANTRNQSLLGIYTGMCYFCAKSGLVT